MKFVYPQFLYGLFALLIPVLIHLFNFRRYKKIYFSDTHLLKEIKEESESKSKLKKILILISRMLALAMLVICFAQPYIPADKTEPGAKSKQFSFFIDNSYSMNGIGKKGALLEEAKQKSIEMAKGFGKDAEFQLVTQNYSGAQQRWLNYEEFIEQVAKIELSPSTQDLYTVYQRQSDFIKRVKNVESKTPFIWLSDFQQYASDFSKILPDSTHSIVMIPFRANEKNNLFVDSVWFEQPVQQPGQVQTLFANIQNLSNKEYENGTLDLFINGQKISPAAFSIKAGEKKRIEFKFLIRETGIHNAYVELQDYPHRFDNRMYFSFDVKTNIPVLSIANENESGMEFIRALFKNDSLFNYDEVNEKSPDFSRFKKNSIIYLCGLKSISSGMARELKKFCEGGGYVVVFPPVEGKLEGYNPFLSEIGINYSLNADTINTSLENLKTEHELFQGVFEKKPEKTDLPIVFTHYGIENKGSMSYNSIIGLLNGKSFLSECSLGKGKLYLFATPLSGNWSNFPRHALFVPFLIKMCLLSQPKPDLYYPIQHSNAILFQGMEVKNEKPFHLTSIDGKTDIIPELHNVATGVNLFLQNQIEEPGNYFLKEENNILTGLSFNLRSLESNLDCLNDEQLEKQCRENPGFRFIADHDVNLSSKVLSFNDGESYWKMFLFLTLLFVITEIILLRFIK